LAWTRNTHLEQQSETDAVIVSEPGESLLAVVSGDDYPEIIRTTEQVLTAGITPLLERTREQWWEFSQARTNFRLRVEASLPDRDLLLRTVDDVAVLLAVQQTSDGGVLAGHNYHWCGVRDQYGVGRTLLFLGEPKQARAIYDFYWSIWQHYHVIHNGQGIGTEMFFHIH
jgi:GH15 family glucan-1,4-alpha-glucosidase